MDHRKNKKSMEIENFLLLLFLYDFFLKISLKYNINKMTTQHICG